MGRAADGVTAVPKPLYFCRLQHVQVLTELKISVIINKFSTHICLTAYWADTHLLLYCRLRVQAISES